MCPGVRPRRVSALWAQVRGMVTVRPDPKNNFEEKRDARYPVTYCLFLVDVERHRDGFTSEGWVWHARQTRRRRIVSWT